MNDNQAGDVLRAMVAPFPRPLIFGHSGAQAYAPANTLPAFELAMRQGAHGTELDVHRSKDGHVVVIHDFTVDATTNGSGRVADLTLAELKALDAGSHFAPEFAGVQIPTLDEVFAAVGRSLLINVEIKSMTRDTDGIEAAVADCIRRHAMQARVIVSSFNPLALQRFRAVLPEVPVGFLYGSDSPEIVWQVMQNFTVEAVHPQDHLIDAALVNRAHANGELVNAWTVNDLDRARSLAAFGVDTIITDMPDVLLRVLHAGGLSPVSAES